MFEKIKLIATCAFGLESEVSYELRQLGYDKQTKSSGQVIFEGDFSAMARANMWLRTAERVRWLIGEFEASTFTELYDNIYALPWGDIIEEKAAFPVDGNSIRSQLSSVPAVQRISKKAVVDAMSSTYGISTLPESGNTYRIRVALLDNKVTVALDSSGVGLHKRGYRSLAYEAPMKETLAASLVRLSRWKGNRLLVDPFCGSGTILIEAALIGRNIAPGLKRNFAGEDWQLVPSNVWKDARIEAEDLAQRDRKLSITGSDISLSAIELATHHAREMKVDDCISFSRMDVADFLSPHSNGMLICNPPYGERIGDEEEAKGHIRVLGDLYNKHRDWSFYMISPDSYFEMYFGKQSSKRRKLYNGRIKCNLYSYFGASVSRVGGNEESKGNFLKGKKLPDFKKLLVSLRKVPLQKLKPVDLPPQIKKQLFTYATAREEKRINELMGTLVEALKTVEPSSILELAELTARVSKNETQHSNAQNTTNTQTNDHSNSSAQNLNVNKDVKADTSLTTEKSIQNTPLPGRGNQSNKSKLSGEQADHMRIERWRDGLLEKDNSFIEAISKQYPKADIKHIKKLVDRTLTEIDENKPPRSKRKLFRYLKSLAN